MRLYEIANLLGATATANPVIDHLVTDNKEVKPGDLYLALKGKRYDGNCFSKDAEKRGAFVLGKECSKGIKTEDTASSLLTLAEYYKSKLRDLKKTVAITGSVGKTTTKEFLKVLLSTQYKTEGTPGNLNNLIGLPLTVLSTQADCEALILEMGMNAPGEIEKLSLCARPDLAVITKIGTSHIGNLGSREAIAKAKLEVKRGLNGQLIVPLGENLLEGDITFSNSSPDADVFLTQSNSEVTVHERSGNTYNCIFSIKGRHVLECLAAAVCAARACGITEENIKAGVSYISPEILRQKVTKLGNIVFIEDYYNSSPESVEAGLDYLCGLAGYSVKSVLLGDILELGTMSKEIHRRLGALLASSGLTHLYLFGEQMLHAKDGAIEAGFPEERIFYNSDLSRPDITAKAVLESTKKGEIIFCKGSRGVRLERIMEYIKVNEDKI